MQHEEFTDEQPKNKHNADHLAPWQFKPGQSGNPKGRHPGKSLKEYGKEYLASLTEEERLEYFRGMNKIDVWKMVEGNPHNDLDVKGSFNISNVLDELENEGHKISNKELEDK